MKKLLLVILILSFSCVSPPKKKLNKHEQSYKDVIVKMKEQYDRLGNWVYSPDGKDSLWEKTYVSYNLILLDSVLAEVEPLEREWDSLWFIARKYDSIPFPSEKRFESYKSIREKNQKVVKVQRNIEELVDAGVYDKNGKMLRDLTKE